MVDNKSIIYRLFKWSIRKLKWYKLLCSAIARLKMSPILDIENTATITGKKVSGVIRELGDIIKQYQDFRDISTFFSKLNEGEKTVLLATFATDEYRSSNPSIASLNVSSPIFFTAYKSLDNFVSLSVAIENQKTTSSTTSATPTSLITSPTHSAVRK